MLCVCVFCVCLCVLFSFFYYFFACLFACVSCQRKEETKGKGKGKEHATCVQCCCCCCCCHSLCLLLARALRDCVFPSRSHVLYYILLTSSSSSPFSSPPPTAADPEPEIPTGPGIDPNHGPTIKQWSQVLNATASFPLYHHSDRTALHAAVVGQHAPVISALLSASVDVNIADLNGLTPLMSSLGQGDDKVTKDLLYIGAADVNAVDARGNNVLKYSFVAPAGKGKLAKTTTTTTTTTTTQSSSNNNQAEDKASEILPTVVGNDRNTRLLLRGGVDVTVCDADGNFPLHWLCRGT